MSIPIPTPAITAPTEAGQLRQIRSYLVQMSRQLQWAFDTLEAGSPQQVSSLSGNQQQKQPSAPSDPAATFASLKNLIIKSADIVDSYYDTISRRLEGIYVAQSDFGIYRQETAQELRETAGSVDRLFTNSQTILAQVQSLEADKENLSSKVGDLEETARESAAALEDLTLQSRETRAYVKTGLLYYEGDGTPVYGLEIGQTNAVEGSTTFDKFARFTADRLSFFDRNDVEVAYISDYRLCITNAEITGSLQLTGRFKIYFNGGLAFQWTGGTDNGEL